MIKLKINNNSFNCFEKWSEVTIKKANELSLVVNTMPEKLGSLYKSIVEKDNEAFLKIVESITIEEQQKEFNNFYGKCIKALTTIDQETIDGIFHEDRKDFYEIYLIGFVLGLIYGDWSQIKEIKSFNFKGKEYFLPKYKMVIGNKIPMADATTLEFTEVADLMAYGNAMIQGKWGIANNICAILCRQRDKAYIESESMATAEIFEGLTMDVVFEVFFCFIKPKNTYENIMQTFTGVHQHLSLMGQKIKVRASAGMVV